MHQATSTGQVTVVSGLASPLSSTFALAAALYRTGAPTATASERNAAVRGWVSSTFEVQTLFGAALRGHSGLAVRLSQQTPQGKLQLVGQSGWRAELRWTRSTFVDANGRWLISVGTSNTDPADANTEAGFVLAASMLLTVLAALLLLRVTRARDQALRLLQRRDGELLHRALYDELTGLPNRTMALQRADLLLARARLRQTPLAALLLNLDGFRDLNTRLSREAGDDLLRVVAERLRAGARGSDTIARFGDDEFLILTEPSTSNSAPELVAERVLEVLRQPVELAAAPEESISMTASIGIAFAHSGSVQDLERDLAVALHEAKALGKDRWVTFDPSIKDAADDRLCLETEFREALDADQFELLYRPGVDLHTGRVSGVEALPRWRHPRRGLLTPDAFSDLAEETGQLPVLARWILDEACSQAAAWRSAGLQLTLAVNVSALEVERSGLVDDVASALASSGLDPSTLALEVHEAALRRAPATVSAFFESVTALGARIIIDHFGTGYTSARQLRRYPISSLKIDGSFVGAIAEGSNHDALIQTFVGLGKELDMRVVAEGVASPIQLEQLCRAGCDVVQGRLISDPLEAPAVERFIAGWPESSPLFERARDNAIASITAEHAEAGLEVLLIDDQLAVRKGIELLLKGEGFRIAGVASELDQASALIRRRRHDVALVSMRLRGSSAIPLIEQVVSDHPNAPIVLYTGTSHPAELEEALRAGPPGLVLMSSPAARLVEAIQTIGAGARYVDPALAPLLAQGEESKVVTLSPREHEIFTLLAEGLTGQAIAERLFLSPETVKTHIRNATTKLGAKTRVQAVAQVVRESVPSRSPS